MGLRERLGLAAGEAADDPDDYIITGYQVCHKGLGGNAGWVPLGQRFDELTEGDWDNLDTPKTFEDVKFNFAPLPPGHYRLFALDQHNRRHRPPEDVAWKHKEPDPDAEPATPREELRDAADPDEIAARAAEQAVTAIEERRDGAGGVADPEAIQAQMKANIMQMAINNPAFVAEHGETLALAAFDATGVMGNDDAGATVDFEDFSEDPMKATFFQLTQDPDRLEQMGEAVGQGAGAFFDGVAAGVDEDAATAGDGADEGWAPSDVAGGPASMDDLADAADDAPLADADAADPDAPAADVDLTAATATTTDADAAAAVADDLADLLAAQRRVERGTVDDAPTSATAGDDAAPGARDDERRGLTAGPSQATEAELAAESEVAAGPDVAEAAADGGQSEDAGAPDATTDDTALDLDPDRCQAITGDDEQCGNEPTDGDYCWIPTHGPPDAAPDDDAAATDDGEPTTADAGPTATDDAGDAATTTTDPAAIAEEL